MPCGNPGHTGPPACFGRSYIGLSHPICFQYQHTIPDVAFDDVQETEVLHELQEMQEAKGDMQPHRVTLK